MNREWIITRLGGCASTNLDSVQHQQHMKLWEARVDFRPDPQSIRILSIGILFC